MSAKTESPEYLKLSLASAMALGFHPGRFYRNARNTCINLLLSYSEGCSANCAYCGLARERKGRYEEKSFIHVGWPLLPLEEIVSAIKERQGRVTRICLSMVTNRRARADVSTIARKITEKIDLPFSTLISPTIIEPVDLVEYRKSGVDRIGVAIDTVTEEIFNRYRGKETRGPHRWQRYWEILGEAIRIFGKGKVGVHLIVGLGESERQMVEMIQKVYDLGSSTHLFSFFAEEGSALEDLPSPPLDQYRRIQLGRYLIDEGIGNFQEFKFDSQGKIIDFGQTDERLDQIIALGTPFMTSGCPDRKGKVACNRPYGNCLPGPDIRNYPFLPEPEDIERIMNQLGRAHHLDSQKERPKEVVGLSI
ncbi:MAG: radical SAM protein [Deltaproteobacteria bacterium]|nr:MAG: radical SAM protein [Deltaproteobacteria bacterium]